MTAGKLTPKQERFVAEYLVDLNATQAAIRAGYSKHTADVQGPRLLGNVGVAAAIAEGRAKLAESTGLTQQMVIEGLLKEARRDGEGSSHGARVSAYGWLGKTMGMFVDRTEIDIHGSIAERMARARKRLAK